jgi:hypothetical protein
MMTPPALAAILLRWCGGWRCDGQRDPDDRLWRGSGRQRRWGFRAPWLHRDDRDDRGGWTKACADLCDAIGDEFLEQTMVRVVGEEVWTREACDLHRGSVGARLWRNEHPGRMHRDVLVLVALEQDVDDALRLVRLYDEAAVE